MPHQAQITVGELKSLLGIYPDDMGVYFGGLDFYRLNDKGDLVNFEWGAKSVSEDADGRVFVEND